MTSDSLRRLQSLAEADDELMTALRGATTWDEVVRIAAQHGIELEASELGTDPDLSDAELSDADLESAAGGVHPKYSTFDYSCP